MLYQSFHDYYPEVAEKETRCLTLHNDPEAIAGLRGPCLNLSSLQSPFAPFILEKFHMLIADSSYVERLRRHYEMFKMALPKKRKRKKRA